MRLVPLSGALRGRQLDFSASDPLPAYYLTAGGAGWDGSAGAFSRVPVGAIIHAGPSDAIDVTANVPNWGYSELMYVVNTSSSTFGLGRLVTVNKNFAIADHANTANLAQPIYVVLTAFAAGNVTPQGGWVMRSGIAPVQYAVAATTGPVFIGGAGQATPTDAAGKDIFGMTCLIAASGSFTRTATAQNGSKLVTFSGGTKGMYPGAAISQAGNTPIPAGTVISTVEPDGRSITISNAAVASGDKTATITHTGFGICLFNAPHGVMNVTA